MRYFVILSNFWLCSLWLSSVGFAAGDLVRISEGAARILLITKTDPEYPRMAREMRLSGRVNVDCYIELNGDVEKVQILNGNPLFTTSITNTLRKWKFRPVEVNGKATQAVATFVFEFKR